MLKKFKKKLKHVIKYIQIELRLNDFLKSILDNLFTLV